MTSLRRAAGIMRCAGFLALPASLLGAPACGAETPDTYSREQLLEPTTCGECHQEYYDEWSGSMHAYASKDPVFRAMNERGQKDAALGDFCVKCHAPMAVNEGKTRDGLNLDQLPDELQGVTCYYCHQVSDPGHLAECVFRRDRGVDLEEGNSLERREGRRLLRFVCRRAALNRPCPGAILRLFS